MKNRCLYCYEPLSEGERVDYHAKCCRKLFGTSQAPVLPYTSNEVRALADEVVRSQTTVTGVQPKLSPLEVLWNRSQKKKLQNSVSIVTLMSYGTFLLCPINISEYI